MLGWFAIGRINLTTDTWGLFHSQAERANAQLKMRYNALRRVSLCPWRIGQQGRTV